jgi:hypothetical protein
MFISHDNPKPLSRISAKLGLPNLQNVPEKEMAALLEEGDRASLLSFSLMSQH